MADTNGQDAATIRQFLAGPYSLRRPQLKQATIEQYGYSIGSFGRHLGREPVLADFTDGCLQRFIRARLAEVSAKTVHRERQDLLCLWREAARDGLVAPPGDVPRVKVPKRNPIAFWPEELSRLLAACSSLRGCVVGTEIPRSAWARSFLLALYDTGARKSALLACEAPDLDWDRKMVRLSADHAKTGLEQWVGLSDQSMEALLQIWVDRRVIWPWPGDRRQLYYLLDRLLLVAGLPCDRYHKWHAIRRTTATYLTKAGGLGVAQQVLGHTSPSQTLGYVDQRHLDQVNACGLLPRV